MMESIGKEPVMRVDKAAAREFLATTAPLVVVHDVMAEVLTDLWGIYARASTTFPEDSADRLWWRAQAQAVKAFRATIDVTDRQAMLAALDRARAERDRARESVAA